MKRLAIAAVLVAVALTSCGDPSISRATTRDLQARVARIRAAVEDGRAFLAKQRLTNLSEAVARLLDRGDLDATKAGEIVDAIAVVRAALPAMPEPPPSPTETMPPPTDEDDDGEGDGGNGNAYGHDKDKGGGHGNNDEGDD